MRIVGAASQQFEALANQLELLLLYRDLFSTLPEYIDCLTLTKVLVGEGSFSFLNLVAKLSCPLKHSLIQQPGN